MKQEYSEKSNDYSIDFKIRTTIENEEKNKNKYIFHYSSFCTRMLISIRWRYPLYCFETNQSLPLIFNKKKQLWWRNVFLFLFLIQILGQVMLNKN